MAQCTWIHTWQLPAPGSCGSALPGSGTGFCRWAARRCTSLWDTERPGVSPDPRPGAGRRPDSLRSAAALWMMHEHHLMIMNFHKALKQDTSAQHSQTLIKLYKLPALTFNCVYNAVDGTGLRSVL